MPKDEDLPEQIYPPPHGTGPVEPKYDPADYKRIVVEFTYERRMRYLSAMRQHGRPGMAAALAGVSPAQVLSARKKDPDFDAAVAIAKDLYVEEVLIAEAERRAVKGVSKPVIGGRNRDEVVAEEIVYSDSLLSLLLKSKAPEFKDGPGDASKYAQMGGVVVIPAGPGGTSEDWEKDFGALANPTDKSK